ncbi:hypothetical protein TNCV_2813931 [Trichonephila clavipes]|nr:hypothetical protein TNCV_2813931 [Trichonephila clavipes]
MYTPTIPALWGSSFLGVPKPDCRQVLTLSKIQLGGPNVLHLVKLIEWMSKTHRCDIVQKISEMYSIILSHSQISRSAKKDTQQDAVVESLWRSIPFLPKRSL